MEKEELMKLIELAEKGDGKAQFKIAKNYYDEGLFDMAYDWLTKTLRNSKIDLKTRESAMRLINSKSINDMFPSSLTAYDASRITRGGNAPSGTFSKSKIFNQD